MAISDWLKNLFKASAWQGTVASDEQRLPPPLERGVNHAMQEVSAKLARQQYGLEAYLPIAKPLPPGQITEHFSWAEAMSTDGEPVPEEYKQNAREVAELLELIRQFFGGRPVKVNSWYRSAKRNDAIKKAAIAAGRPGNVASKSQHLTASAADIAIGGVDIAHVQGALEMIWRGKDVSWEGGPRIANEIRARMGGLGRGAHRGFVHIDIRKKRAIFNYV